MPPILQKDKPLLRRTAAAVPLTDIKSAAVQKVIGEMSRILAPIPDGLALAAPQLGVLRRIFIVSGKLFPDAEGKKTKDLVFINPEIKKRSRKKILVEEGCLSVRGLSGQMKRAVKVTVRAFDETGRQLTSQASGLLAQIFQHEIDHLNGILFIDEAKNVREIKP